MSINRRQFMQGALAAGVTGSAAMLNPGRALSAVHNPVGEAQAELFGKFKGNVEKVFVGPQDWKKGAI